MTTERMTYNFMGYFVELCYKIEGGKFNMMLIDNNNNIYETEIIGMSDFVSHALISDTYTLYKTIIENMAPDSAQKHLSSSLGNGYNQIYTFVENGNKCIVFLVCAIKDKVVDNFKLKLSHTDHLPESEDDITAESNNCMHENYDDAYSDEPINIIDKITRKLPVVKDDCPDFVKEMQTEKFMTNPDVGCHMCATDAETGSVDINNGCNIRKTIDDSSAENSAIHIIGDNRITESIEQRDKRIEGMEKKIVELQQAVDEMTAKFQLLQTNIARCFNV